MAGDAAGLLSTESAAVEAAFGADDADLFVTAFADAVGAGEFNGAFGGFGAGGEEENFIQTFGRELDEEFGELGAFFAGENVVVQQAGVDLLDDGLADLGSTMAAIGDEHAGTPVEPFVSVFVVNENVIGTVPDEGRLAAHGLGLELAKFFESGDGIRMRQGRDDAAVFGFDARDGARGDAKFFAHKRRECLPRME